MGHIVFTLRGGPAQAAYVSASATAVAIVCSPAPTSGPKNPVRQSRGIEGTGIFQPVPRGEASEAGLHGILRLLRRRRWTIVVAVLVVTVPALVVSFLAQPVYEATAKVLLRPAAVSVFDADAVRREEVALDVQGEIEVMESEPVRASVLGKLGKAPRVSVRPDTQTNSGASVNRTAVIVITAKSADRRDAAAVANAYGSAYVDVRRQQASDALVAASQRLQAKIQELGSEAAALDAQLAAMPLPERSAPAARSADQRRGSLLEQQALFKRRFDQLQVDASLVTGGAQVVRPATAPTSPASPKPVRNGLLALFVGLNLGVGLAFAREHLDERLKSKEDVERVVAQLPVLGIVPAVPNWKDRLKPKVVSLTDPGSGPAEAYRSLRTSLQFTGVELPYRLQVTSPNAGEGKTTTLANLAVAFARVGRRVVVVCCDLRRPRLHEFFGVENDVGVTSVLNDGFPLGRALKPVAGLPHIAVLTAGPRAENPSELVASTATRELIAHIQGRCDVVLVDSAPVLPVSDAAVLSDHVDATLVVASAGKTTRTELRRSLDILRQVDAPVIGVVINQVAHQDTYQEGYSYEYQDGGRRGPAHARRTIRKTRA